MAQSTAPDLGPDVLNRRIARDSRWMRGAARMIIRVQIVWMNVRGWEPFGVNVKVLLIFGGVPGHDVKLRDLPKRRFL